MCCYCFHRIKTQNFPFWNEEEMAMQRMGGEGGREETRITEKRSSIIACVLKRREIQGLESHPAQWESSSFFQSISVKYLYISLQGFPLVTPSVYINPQTRETLSFCSIAMAQIQIKLHDWVRAVTSDLNFIHHWNLCRFDSF